MSVTSGWGRLTWDQSQWGGSTILNLGWGAKSWNDGEWGELNDITVSLTGQSFTTELGIQGWSNNAYGRGAWGEFAIDVGLGPDVSVSGLSVSTTLGTSSVTGTAVIEPTAQTLTASAGSLSVESDANVSMTGILGSFTLGTEQLLI